ncbi:MAG: NAD-dependent epimerase/dehydratase family protein [Minisyncoccales bacterium]
MNITKNKRILVTGGAGFIGSHLTDRLIKEGNLVVVIDNLSTGKKENLNKKAKFYKIDICSKKIFEIFKKEKPQIVFHLAALARVPLSILKPLETSKVNILGTINVFKASLENKVQRVIFASSSSVYGPQKTFPLNEKMKPNPISPYGLQKWVGEEFAKLFTNLYGLSIVSLRYFNVYGPRIDFKSDYSLVLGKFLKLSKEKKPLTIFGDGNQTRAFCYIDDVIEANILAMKSKKIKGGEVINVGGQKNFSINYLADLIGGEKVFLPARKGDPLHTKADIHLAKKLLGWKPKTKFQEGVLKTKKWFQSL